ncbi:FMN-binding protein [Rhodococcus sp. CUA-806]|nr:FMN-binding protein [Rhodococcus sp. CUA-806]
MRRITVWILSTISAVVVLFSYHTSTGESSTATSSTSESTDFVPTAPTPTTVGATEESVKQTFTGTAASTRFGPVQVQITVTSGKITDATAVDYPTNNARDRQINSRAVPTLEAETIAAQSAEIHMVSGATYTSEGYVQSLQSAIDQAHLE